MVFREFDYIASRRDSTSDTSKPEGNLETARQNPGKTYQELIKYLILLVKVQMGIDQSNAQSAAGDLPSDRRSPRQHISCSKTATSFFNKVFIEKLIKN